MPPEALQIVLDENLPWSVAAELKARGYAATLTTLSTPAASTTQRGLRWSGTSAPPAVLVTYDNAMPVEHETWLRSLSVTLSVIDSRNRPPDLTVEQYWRDVIHRHAHSFASQENETWWKYHRATRRRIDLG